MKHLLCLLIIISVSGCENGNLAITQEQREAVKATIKKRGEARERMFTQCMELAAKMPRQADDDVSNIVYECQSSSHYITNYIK